MSFTVERSSGYAEHEWSWLWTSRWKVPLCTGARLRRRTRTASSIARRAARSSATNAAKSASRSTISTSGAGSYGGFAGPRGLPGRPVTVQPRTATGTPTRGAGCGPRRSRDATPSGADGRAFGVVGVEPVGVERREFPDQLVVAMPQRWDHRRREAVGVAQPVHPRVEVVPLVECLVRGQEVPVDRAQRALIVEVGGPEDSVGTAELLERVAALELQRLLAGFDVGAHRGGLQMLTAWAGSLTTFISLVGGSGCLAGLRSTT